MNCRTEGIEIMAFTAIVKDEGKHPARVVLCRIWRDDSQDYQYVTWLEVFPPKENNQRNYFVTGEYFDDATEAWSSFSRRSQKLLRTAMEEPVRLAGFPYNRR
jgi:hypothetical protein